MKRSNGLLRIFRNLCLACVALSALSAAADVRLPHVIDSHMVLQRDVPLPIWGWAKPGEGITVKLGEREATTKAGPDGTWQVRLPAMPAGGPHTMTVVGKNRIELKDILVGEVWVCSGQSNMDMGVRSVNNGEQEIANAKHPQIRLFHLPWKVSTKAEDDIDCKWDVCSPETIGQGGFFGVGFSAVAYFFGREIQKEVGVPVGLIQTAWGGTRIEPWTPRVGFALVPGFDDVLRQIDDADANYRKNLRKAVSDYEGWLPAARKAADDGKPVAAPPAWPKHLLEDNAQPTAICNGMIHPIVPFAIRGAIWYQGESNHPDGMAYHDKMRALIGGWRKTWSQGEFPFYYVQIAPFNAIYQGDQLPRLWEAQTASLSIANTGMVVTTDIADLADIHPKNKQDVGRRLALWALAKTYGRDTLVYSGPLYKAMKTEGREARLAFEHVGGGLTSRDGKPLSWFEIAGADKKFVRAEAKIDGETVLVSSDKVGEPVAVRFGWSMAAQPNLMNKEGLPASPFRTDKW